MIEQLRKCELGLFLFVGPIKEMHVNLNPHESTKRLGTDPKTN